VVSATCGAAEVAVRASTDQTLTIAEVEDRDRFTRPPACTHRRPEAGGAGRVLAQVHGHRPPAREIGGRYLVAPGRSVFGERAAAAFTSCVGLREVPGRLAALARWMPRA
jgi:hypothetical protein